MEKVRSNDGQDEMAGVAGMDGDGEDARRGDSLGTSFSVNSSITSCGSVNMQDTDGGLQCRIRSDPDQIRVL